MLNIRWRYPDKPKEIFSLSMVKSGEYLCQTKQDGFRCLILKDNDQIFFMSRHRKPLPVSKILHAEVEKLQMTNGTVFDSEWTSRREANKEEAIYLFSVVYHNYEWLGKKTEEERYNRLEIIKPTANIHIIESKYSDYDQHYKSTIYNWKTEGIVLKKKTTQLIGGLEKSYDNPGFLKAKWRLGSSGTTLNIIPDDKLVYEKCAH